MKSVIPLLICCVVGLNFDETKASGSENWVEINKIPGTGLYTGVFYKIGMKRFPAGTITWTEQRVNRDDANYVQIDLNPNNLPYYNIGEKWENSTLWYFESSEVEGYYILKNRDITNGIVTVRAEGSVAHNYVIVANRTDSVCKLSIIHGSSRKSSLMKPVKVDDTNRMYQLKFLAYPKGIVTWTQTKYGQHSYFIQVSEDVNQKQKFQKGEPFYDDTQFEFIPRSEIRRLDPICC